LAPQCDPQLRLRAVARWKDTIRTEERSYPTHKQTVSTPALSTIHDHVRRGCMDSARKMVTKLNLSKETNRRVLQLLHNELGMTA
jgi:hypothetical protein